MRARATASPSRRSPKKTARCSPGTGTRKVAASTASKTPPRSGLTSARRALRKLGARKIKTTRAPVVFDPDMAASLLRALVGRGLGAVALSRRVVPGRPAGHGNRQRRRDDYRRRHDARRARLEAVRRRRSADHAQERGRARRAQNLPARLVLRAPARPCLDRQRLALGRRRALGQPDQSLPAARHLFSRGDNPHRQERPLCDRAYRLRRQLGHRRLFARRGRDVDRGRRACLPGARRSRSPATSRTCSCRSR